MLKWKRDLHWPTLETQQRWFDPDPQDPAKPDPIPECKQGRDLILAFTFVPKENWRVQAGGSGTVERAEAYAAEITLCPWISQCPDAC